MHYLVRVTIHDGSYAEYQGLHKQMQAFGFSRYIRNDQGIFSVLPDATYIGERNENGDVVRDHVARIAKGCAPSKAAPEVFVCVRGASWWSGLRQAT
ncbi:hypothetical protein SGO26_09350 [Cupriavidus metallidurans]|uniref:hypothetical protein n=1 Tax=Cupriavidus TaxID=106589 RepID=UPI0002E335E8|nr:MULTISPECIES: hypothetical protein [unclassified Cupriavidus]GMG90253.1 hypothetical protein Cmtc_14730 [Cupriavidus sp. TKC]